MNLNEVKAFLAEDWTRFQESLVESLKSDVDLLDTTNATILSGGGKQVRPLLSLLVARACTRGKITDDTISCAVAAELLHNATLLHDDVADESNERRGNPTINYTMGPSVSVLVGDFWLVKAMMAVLDANLSDNMMRSFAGTLRCLAEGEMFQLEKAGKGDTSMEDYLRIIYNKTASLFEVTAFTSAESVGAPKEYEDAVCEYAKTLGLAFQMRDDIFDYSPAMGTVGKPQGIDLLEKKITLPLLEALASASVEEDREIRSMVSVMDQRPENKTKIEDFVRANDGVTKAQRVLNEYVDRAVAALDVLPDTREKQYLCELARYVGHRQR